MAVTVTQYPTGYVPGRNPQIFSATSNQVAQPNFNYTIVITDLVSSESQTYQQPARTDGDVVFNAEPFVRQYLTDELPINEYGWQTADGVRKIRVNIGETYGSTPAYASGTNYEYIAWNGMVDWKEYPIYDPDNYVYDAIAGHIPYLNTNDEEDTYEDRSNYIYALTSKVGDILEIQIDTYNANGSPISSSAIPNPYQGSSNYRDKYLIIDVGHKGLTNIPSGLVTGTYPILTDDVAFYTITDSAVVSGLGTLTLKKTIYMKCECKFDPFTVHYLKKNGAFQTLNFAKKSTRTLNKDQQFYSVLPWEYSGTEYTYSPGARIKLLQYSDLTEKVTLTTDWMTEEEVEYHKDLIDSPIIYFDFGPNEDYLQVVLNTNSYTINKRFNERLYFLTMEFDYAHSNSR